MPADVNTSRTIALLVSATGLLCACGLGPVRNAPPPPPPLPLSISQNDTFQAIAGSMSAPQIITLTNVSSADVLKLHRAELRVNQGLYFHLQTTCADTLAPGASCTLTLTFQPRRAGTFHASVLLNSGPGYETKYLYLIGIAAEPPSVTPGPDQLKPEAPAPR